MLWVGEGRRYETLKEFFDSLIDEQRESIEAIAMDMWEPYIKAVKYLLLKNKGNLREEEKPRLRAILEANEAITTVYILKDYLKKLWQYKYPKWAEKFLDYWCSLAMESKIRPVMAFARTLRRYAYGIINHCKYPLHTSRLEGINNKIKVIKGKAYGFHDIEYFSLVIKNAFAESN